MPDRHPSAGRTRPRGILQRPRRRVVPCWLVLALAVLPRFDPVHAACPDPPVAEVDAHQVRVERPEPGWAVVGWIRNRGAEWEVLDADRALPTWPPREGAVPVHLSAGADPVWSRAIRHAEGPDRPLPAVALSCLPEQDPAARNAARLAELAVAHARLRSNPDPLAAALLAARLFLLRAAPGLGAAEQDWVLGQLWRLAEDAHLDAEAAGWAAVMVQRARTRGPPRLLAHALLAEGRALRERDGQRALARLEEARQRFLELGMAYPATVAEHGVCLQQRLLGALEPAIACYRRVVARQLALGEAAAALYTRLNLATALSLAGRYREAGEELDRAARMPVLASQPEAHASLRRQRAQQLTWAGRFDEALALLGEVAARTDPQDTAGAARIDYLLGSTYRLAGEAGRAVVFFESAVQRLQGTSPSRQRARIRLALAQAQLDLGETEAAREQADRAMAELTRLGEVGLGERALLTLGEIHRRAGNPAAARAALSQVGVSREPRLALRARLLGAALGLTATPAIDCEASLRQVLEEGPLLLALELGEHCIRQRGREGGTDALDLAERLLDRFLPIASTLRTPALRQALLASLHRLGASVLATQAPGAVDPALGARVHHWAARLAQTQMAALAPTADDRLLALERALAAEWLAETDAPAPAGPALRLALPGAAPDPRPPAAPAHLAPDPPPLGAGVMLALPLVSEEDMGWLILDGRRWSWWPIDREAFLDARSALLALLAEGHGDSAEIGRRAAALRAALGWERWLRPGVHTLWIGAQQALATTPLSLALPEGLHPAIGWVLGPDPRATPQPRTVRVLGVAGSPGAGLPPLHAVQAELTAVADTWAASAPVSVHSRARRTDLLEALAAPGALIHLATHARASTHRFEASGLWLAGTGDRPDFLSAQRLRGLAVSAGLVVLSACETGRGGGLFGLGVGGVAEALAEAGADAVVGSRWAVGDRAAMAFSVAFHRALARQPDAPERALAEARAELLRQPALRHPTHWAGWFVLRRAPSAG